MAKLLDLAIAEVRKLPPKEQDETAEMLLWAIETRRGSIPLDEEAIAAIEEGVAQARRGEFATDAEIADLSIPMSSRRRASFAPTAASWRSCRPPTRWDCS